MPTHKPSPKAKSGAPKFQGGSPAEGPKGPSIRGAASGPASPESPTPWFKPVQAPRSAPSRPGAASASPPGASAGAAGKGAPGGKVSKMPRSGSRTVPVSAKGKPAGPAKPHVAAGHEDTSAAGNANGSPGAGKVPSRAAREAKGHDAEEVGLAQAEEEGHGLMDPAADAMAFSAMDQHAALDLHMGGDMAALHDELMEASLLPRHFSEDAAEMGLDVHSLEGMDLDDTIASIGGHDIAAWDDLGLDAAGDVIPGGVASIRGPHNDSKAGLLGPESGSEGSAGVLDIKPVKAKRSQLTRGSGAAGGASASAPSTKSRKLGQSADAQAEADPKETGNSGVTTEKGPAPKAAPGATAGVAGTPVVSGESGGKGSSGLGASPEVNMGAPLPVKGTNVGPAGAGAGQPGSEAKASPGSSLSAGGQGRQAHSGEGRKVSCEDIQLVQNLIERCLQLYMSKKEVVHTLQFQAKIEPGFTALVWQKLEEQNQEFFQAYYTRLTLKDQMLQFNQLLEQHAAMLQRMHPHMPPPPGGIMGSAAAGGGEAAAQMRKAKRIAQHQQMRPGMPPQPMPLGGLQGPFAPHPMMEGAVGIPAIGVPTTGVPHAMMPQPGYLVPLHMHQQHQHQQKPKVAGPPSQTEASKQLQGQAQGAQQLQPPKHTKPQRHPANDAGTGVMRSRAAALDQDLKASLPAGHAAAEAYSLDSVGPVGPQAAGAMDTKPVPGSDSGGVLNSVGGVSSSMEFDEAGAKGEDHASHDVLGLLEAQACGDLGFPFSAAELHGLGLGMPPLDPVSFAMPSHGSPPRNDANGTPGQVDPMEVEGEGSQLGGVPPVDPSDGMRALGQIPRNFSLSDLAADFPGGHHSDNDEDAPRFQDL